MPTPHVTAPPIANRPASRRRWLATLLVGLVGWYLAQSLAVAATMAVSDAPQALHGPPLALFAVVKFLVTTAGIVLAMPITGSRLREL